MRLHIPHNIAPHVDTLQILHRRVIVSPFAILAVVRGNPYSLERALIDAIHEDTLSFVSIVPCTFRQREEKGRGNYLPK